MTQNNNNRSEKKINSHTKEKELEMKPVNIDDRENENSEDKKKKKSSKEDQDKIQLINLQKQLNEYVELVQRKQAEFENFRKRANNEKQEYKKIASIQVFEDLLPIIDNFEKAIESINPEDEEKHPIKYQNDLKAFYNGMVLIDKQLKSMMKKHNVEAIESLGKEFDPNFHEALQVEESDKYDKEIVTAEWQKGYMMHERIIRNAKVVVAKPKEKDENQNKNESEEKVEN